MDTTATQDEMTGTGIITNSSLVTFGMCRRRYYYAYVQGWRPKSMARALRFGSAIHEGIDLLTKGKTRAEVADAIDSIYQIHIVDVAYAMNAAEWQADLAIEAVTVECLVLGYADAWANSPVEILASETPFELPIVNPATGVAIRIYRQAGKRDRLARLPDGRLARMETKTSSEDVTPGSDYRQVLAINQQLSMYMLADRAEGIQTDTCLYDLIRKPTIRPTMVDDLDEIGFPMVFEADGRRAIKKDGYPYKTANKEKGQWIKQHAMTPAEWRAKLWKDIQAQPERYYARQEVPRLESDLEEFRWELYQMAQDVHACHKTGRWYKRTSACRSYGSLCPYYGLCSGQIDATNGIPAGFRQALNIHEELIED